MGLPVGKSMSWYAKPWILVPLYSVPTLLLSILVVYMVQYIVPRFMQYIDDTKVHSRIIEGFVLCILILHLFSYMHSWSGSVGFATSWLPPKYADPRIRIQRAKKLFFCLKKSVNLKEMFITWIQIRIHFIQCVSRIRIRIIVK